MSEQNPERERGDSPYLMGRTREEYDRLRHQAAVLEPAARSVLERAGLVRGMSCLDVGCGPCEVVRLMAEQVGPTGRVVGLDVDDRLGRESIALLKSEGLGYCSFIQGDLRILDEVPGAPFDIVFARLVLVHLEDPVSALRKMYTWLKPGGAIVVQEYCFNSIESFPRFDPVYELKDVFFSTYQRAGRDTQIAMKLPAHFVSAGIGEPEGTDVSGHYESLERAAPMLTAVFRSVLPFALQLGVTTQERAGQFFERMTNLDKSSYVLWPLLFSAWKRKPAQPPAGPAF